MSRISISNLRKSYGSATVIEDLSLEINEGEFLTLLGPSGCGKTTTLRSVAGLETPDAGTITIGEKVVTCIRRSISVPANKRSLGMVFQSYAIWPHMNVFNNVAYPLRRQRVPAAELKSRVMACLESVGLAHAATRLATQLSGGQQQRVALARAMVGDPSVLLFDEPLSNLDAQLRISMRDEILRLRGRGHTSVYVTHDQSEAFALSDRIAIMFDGRIVQLDTVHAIVARPASLAVAKFLGIENLVPAVVRWCESEAVIAELGGVGCRVRVDNVADELSADDEVTVAIRASHVGVSHQPFAENSCRGQVVQVTFFGDALQYRIKVASHQLVARVVSGVGRTFEPGDEVHLHLPAAHLSVFGQNGTTPATRTHHTKEFTS